MLPALKLLKKSGKSENTILFASKPEAIPQSQLTPEEASYAKKQLAAKGKETVLIPRLGKILLLCKPEKGKVTAVKLEKWRKKGESILALLNEHKIGEISIIDEGDHAELALAFAEGVLLGNYQFLKYRKDAEEKESPLTLVNIVSKKLKKESIDQLSILAEAVYRCRTLVNEPLSALNAEGLSAEFEAMGQVAGIKVEVFNKQRIEALRMGGLLAVNRGSIDPPTFTVMEYKPEKPVNKKPLVLVGKGVVYDTGGLSLKPSSSMDTMKCDMAGSAAAAGAIYAIAKAGLPVHVVALMPATDNRPDGNAYVPGDVIHMMDETTVEVLNTDAEGRLILADALTYAKRYDPMLVIDLATLTGAAHAAIGKYGMVAVQSGARKHMEKLKETGLQVHERIAEFPFWDEYGELLKSEVADLKNIGGPYAGAITAGKFLHHFTDYPWIHLDIAGPAFLDKKDGYRSSGGTAVGVRLLFEFARNLGKKS
ncbi:MAG: leucyl aminopeptidase [Bacteroidales bacterium]|nr:leucyl aminopeptidase [Bacteroidales bacterium]